MKQVLINLYDFSELSTDAKNFAISEHKKFLWDAGQEIEDNDGNLVTDYSEPNEIDVIDSIEVNGYLFYKNGRLAKCTTYTGRHPKAGITDVSIKGEIYTIPPPSKPLKTLIGYYTKEKTTEVQEYLNQNSDFYFWDSSSHNDETDSIYCKSDNIVIYIPHAHYKRFTLLVGDNGNVLSYDTKSLKKIVNKLKDIYALKNHLMSKTN